MLVKFKVEREDGTYSISPLISLLPSVPFLSQVDVKRLNITSLDGYQAWLDGEEPRRMFAESTTLADRGARNGSTVVLGLRRDGSGKSVVTADEVIYGGSGGSAEAVPAAVSGHPSAPPSSSHGAGAAMPSSAAASAATAVAGAGAGASELEDAEPAAGPRGFRYFAGGGEGVHEREFPGIALRVQEETDKLLEEQIFTQRTGEGVPSRVLTSVRVTIQEAKKKGKVYGVVARSGMGAYALFIVEAQGWLGESFVVRDAIPMITGLEVSEEVDSNKGQSCRFTLAMEGRRLALRCDADGKARLLKALALGYERMYQGQPDREVFSLQVSSVKFATRHVSAAAAGNAGTGADVRATVLAAVDDPEVDLLLELEPALRSSAARRAAFEALINVVGMGAYDRDRNRQSRVLDLVDVLLAHPVLFPAAEISAVVKRLWSQQFVKELSARAIAQAALLETYAERVISCAIPQEVEFPPEFFSSSAAAAAATSAAPQAFSSGRGLARSANNAGSSGNLLNLALSPSLSSSATSSSSSSSWGAGVTLACVFYTDDNRVLVDASHNPPSVFLQSLYKGALDESSPDFEWLMLLGPMLPDRPTHHMVDGQDPFPLRTRFTEGVSKIKTMLGVASLGMLYDTPIYFEGTRTTLLCTASKIAEPNRFYGTAGNLMWQPLAKVDAELGARYGFSAVAGAAAVASKAGAPPSSSASPRSFIKDVIAFHQKVATPVPPGLYVAHLCSKSDFDGQHVVVHESCSNLPPMVKVRDSHLNRAEWCAILTQQSRFSGTTARPGPRPSISAAVAPPPVGGGATASAAPGGPEGEGEDLGEFEEALAAACGELRASLGVTWLGSLYIPEPIFLDETSQVQVIVFTEISSRPELPEAQASLGWIYKPLRFFEVKHYSVYAPVRYIQFMDATLSLSREVAQFDFMPPGNSDAERKATFAKGKQLKREFQRRTLWWEPMRWASRVAGWAVARLAAAAALAPQPGGGAATAGTSSSASAANGSGGGSTASSDPFPGTPGRTLASSLAAAGRLSVAASAVPSRLTVTSRLSEANSDISELNLDSFPVLTTAARLRRVIVLGLSAHGRVSSWEDVERSLTAALPKEWSDEDFEALEALTGRVETRKAQLLARWEARVQRREAEERDRRSPSGHDSGLEGSGEAAEADSDAKGRVSEDTEDSDWPRRAAARGDPAPPQAAPPPIPPKPKAFHFFPTAPGVRATSLLDVDDDAGETEAEEVAGEGRGEKRNINNGVDAGWSPALGAVSVHPAWGQAVALWVVEGCVEHALLRVVDEREIRVVQETVADLVDRTEARVKADLARLVTERAEREAALRRLEAQAAEEERRLDLARGEPVPDDIIAEVASAEGIYDPACDEAKPYGREVRDCIEDFGSTVSALEAVKAAVNQLCVLEEPVRAAANLSNRRASFSAPPTRRAPPPPPHASKQRSQVDVAADPMGTSSHQHHQHHQHPAPPPPSTTRTARSVTVSGRRGSKSLLEIAQELEERKQAVREQALRDIERAAHHTKKS